VTSYFIRKVLIGIPVLIAVVTLVFLAIRLTPGDPVRHMLPPDASEADVTQMREHLGLDQSFLQQYFIYWKQILHGDFGNSLRTRRPVWDELASRMPYTAELALVAIILSALIGVPIGVYSAIRQNTVFDGVMRVAAFIGVSFPSFWLGTMFILLFALQLGWLPASGRAGPLWTLVGFRSILLPALTLAINSAGSISRMTRSSMLEVIRQDYIVVAKAKGLRESRVHWKHSLKNALIPVITLLGMQFGFLLGGAVIAETIFAWPGLGQLAVKAILFRDYPLIQGVVFFFATSVVLVNLLVDLTYMFVDPRVTTS
jgi:peptide/nickel transport system permease protein